MAELEQISATAEYYGQLTQLIQPGPALKKHGYIMQPLTEQELLLKRRCNGCGKAMSQIIKDKSWALPTDALGRTLPRRSPDGVTKGSPRNGDPTGKKGAPVDGTPTFRCRFHLGEVQRQYWTCCNQHMSAEPCGGSLTHNPRDDPLPNLVNRYQFHYTPAQPSHPNDVRAAVAMDCEMGTAASGDSELIRITLIDYFTSEILVNNLVQPDVPMAHLNTRFSGVTFADLRKAKQARACLWGVTGARKALWRYVGTNTIIIGHGLQNDLRSLKWIHSLVVDSLVIEMAIKKAKEEAEQKEIEKEEQLAIAQAAAEGRVYVKPEPVKESPTPDPNLPPGQKKPKSRGRGDLSLKTLAEKRLGRKIQTGEGKTGHDSLEDSIAARDLVHWHIMHPGDTVP